MKGITFACEYPHGMDALMSGHFGCCPYYTMVDVEKDEIKNVHVIENPYADKHIPGNVPYFMVLQAFLWIPFPLHYFPEEPNLLGNKMRML
jgi:hypothetical protein